MAAKAHKVGIADLVAITTVHGNTTLYASLGKHLFLNISYIIFSFFHRNNVVNNVARTLTTAGLDQVLSFYQYIYLVIFLSTDFLVKLDPCFQGSSHVPCRTRFYGRTLPRIRRIWKFQS